jgi:hypothetical protein
MMVMGTIFRGGWGPGNRVGENVRAEDLSTSIT